MRMLGELDLVTIRARRVLSTCLHEFMTNFVKTVEKRGEKCTRLAERG
jgi:hypothetical protein